MFFKKLTSLIIAYSFLLQMGSQFGVWVNYMTHFDDALKQCENKNNKAILCYGNCVLVTDIKALEKHQSKDNSLQLKAKEIQLFSPTEIIIEYFISEFSTKLQTLFKVSFHSDYFLSIFHPPD
jgi:hypothetical protein